MIVNDEKAIIDPTSQIESSKSGGGQQLNQVHNTRTKKLCFWAYLSVLTLFLGGMLAMTSFSWTPMELHSSSDNYYFANQIAYEWTLGFVQDIVITKGSCPDGYQSAVEFQWPGIGFGCYCSTNQDTSFVLQGYCSASLIQSNCVNVPSQSPITGTKWRNASSICMKRSTVSFANEKKYDNSGNYKLCGSSSSLTIIPLSEPCPFVNISFSNFSLENNSAIVSDADSVLSPMFAAFNSTSPYSFYSYPVIKFAVSEYEFCLMDQDSGIDPDHSDFLLLNKPRGCIDPGNYTRLDTLSEIQFYGNNPQIDALSQRQGYPKPSSWEYKWGFANLPSWTYQCRHNYNGKFSIPRAREQLNFDYFVGYKVGVIFLVCLLVCIGSEVFILGIRRCFNSSIYPTGYKQYYLPVEFCKAITRYVIDFTCKVMILGIVLYLTWTSYYNWNWFKAVANFNCYENNPDMLTKVIQPYTQLYLRNMSLSIGMTIITLIMIIIDIVHFCYIYKHELQHYLVQTEGKILIKQTEDEDLKWMQQKSEANIMENIEDNPNDDEFKITMAQNMFSMQEEPYKNDRPKKKKKKKSYLPSRRFNHSQEVKAQKSPQISGGFNPYDLEDPSFFNMDSIMSSPKKEQPSSINPLKKRKK